MARPAAFLRLVGYSLFPIPLLLLLIYLATQFPRPQESLHIHPSLASVPRSNRVWEIYNEDYFPGGGYAVLPYGRVSLQLDLPVPYPYVYDQVRYWLMGPEDGEKASCPITLRSFSHTIPSGRLDTWITPSRHYLEERCSAVGLSWISCSIVRYVSPVRPP